MRGPFAILYIQYAGFRPSFLLKSPSTFVKMKKEKKPSISPALPHHPANANPTHQNSYSYAGLWESWIVFALKDMALLKIIFLPWWLQHPSFCATLYFLFFSVLFNALDLMHSRTPHEQQLSNILELLIHSFYMFNFHVALYLLWFGKRKNEVWCWESWRVHSNCLDPVVSVFFWLVMHMAQATSFAPCYMSGVDWVSLVPGCLG